MSKRELSEKQLQALKDNQHIGFKIRNLMCMMSIANRNCSEQHQKLILAIVDTELNNMGYESYTEHRKRIHEFWYTANHEEASKVPNHFFKLKRLAK